jgi:hypothetical protein
MDMHTRMLADSTDRRSFIGGSDARTIMGDDVAALIRLWKEKRGEVEPEDLSGNLIVQLGTVTETSTGTGLSAILGPAGLPRSCRASPTQLGPQVAASARSPGPGPFSL